MNPRAPMILGALLAAVACETSKDSPYEGETHWLGECETGEDCPLGKCLCGVCTKVCDGDGDCDTGGAAALCYDTASPGLSAKCGGTTAGAVCLASCGGDGDCPVGTGCHLGACTAVETRQDAGALPDPSQFQGVSVNVDFSEPVTLPRPDVHFSGDASAFIGSWAEDPCGYYSSCMHLKIERTTDGDVVGTIWQERGNSAPPPPAVVHGPFATATDPTVGYPTELLPDQYRSAARNLLGGVQYRVFDGIARGDRLSFWASPFDLWTDWCSMQLAHRWTVAERTDYRCVPQTASEANTDLGVLTLCSSVEDMAYCPNSAGTTDPCVCLDDQLQFVAESPLCSYAYCECSADECHADFRGVTVEASLRLEGDTLIGTIDDANASPHTLRRVAQ